MSCVELIHIIFEGLTAIGTVGAVVTSLWLASFTLKIRAKSEISFATFYVPSSDKIDTYTPQEEFIRITVINTGSKSFTLSHFIAQDKKNKITLQAFPNYQNHLCTPPNFIYIEATTGNYVFDYEAFLNSFIEALNLKRELNQKLLKKRLKNVKFFAITNTGYQIKVEYNNEFINDWVELILNKINPNSPTAQI